MSWKALEFIIEAVPVSSRNVKTLSAGSALTPYRPGSFPSGPPSDHVALMVPASETDQLWFLLIDLELQRPDIPKGGWTEAGIDAAVIEAFKQKKKGKSVGVSVDYKGKELIAFYGANKILTNDISQVPEEIQYRIGQVDRMMGDDPNAAAVELGMPEESYLIWKMRIDSKSGVGKSGKMPQKPEAPWHPSKEKTKDTTSQKSSGPSAWEKLMQKQDPKDSEEPDWMKRALGKDQIDDPNYPSFEKNDDQFKSPAEIQKARDKEASERDLTAKMNAPASTKDKEADEYPELATPKSAATKVKRGSLFKKKINVPD